MPLVIRFDGDNLWLSYVVLPYQKAEAEQAHNRRERPRSC